MKSLKDSYCQALERARKYTETVVKKLTQFTGGKVTVDVGIREDGERIKDIRYTDVENAFDVALIWAPKAGDDTVVTSSVRIECEGHETMFFNIGWHVVCNVWDGGKEFLFHDVGTPEGEARRIYCEMNEIEMDYEHGPDPEPMYAESRECKGRNLLESFLGNRQRGGFDASKVMRWLKDGKYDSEDVIAACVSALEEKQKAALALKLVKQLSSDGILAKVYRKSGEFGTKEI